MRKHFAFVFLAFGSPATAELEGAPLLARRLSARHYHATEYMLLGAGLHLLSAPRPPARPPMRQAAEERRAGCHHAETRKRPEHRRGPQTAGAHEPVKTRLCRHHRYVPPPAGAAAPSPPLPWPGRNILWRCILQQAVLGTYTEQGAPAAPAATMCTTIKGAVVFLRWLLLLTGLACVCLRGAPVAQARRTA